MNTAINQNRQINTTKSSFQHITSYLLKALTFLTVLLLFAKFTVKLPTLVVGVIWGALSLFICVGFTYCSVIKKMKTRQTLQPDGIISTKLAGHLLRMIISFFVSAFFVLALLIGAASWSSVDWIVAAAAVVFFFLSLLNRQ